MDNLDNIKKELAANDALERKLHLKQLQITSLLNITQAINDNIEVKGLYGMYSYFLSWDMGVKKMALFVKKNEKWECTTSFGTEDRFLNIDVDELLGKYNRTKILAGEERNFLSDEFDIVIPVLHKETPISYTFIGGYENNEDAYNNLKFITTITNIIAVAIENKRMFKQQINQERMNREMELATDMQEMLVPTNLPRNEYYELASIYVPHLRVGGDYFDFRELNNDRLAFCVADISGKGLAAALLMANFQANFQSLITRQDSLDEFIGEINEAVFRSTKGERFLTFFVGEYCKKTRTLKYVNAGHNRPILATQDGIKTLDKGSTIIGSFEKLPFIELGDVKIEGPATLLCYTDGVTDIQNSKGDYFSEDKLANFVASNAHHSAEIFNKKLMQQINLYKEDLILPDDLTVLTCKFL